MFSRLFKFGKKHLSQVIIFFTCDVRARARARFMSGENETPTDKLSIINNGFTSLITSFTCFIYTRERENGIERRFLLDCFA